MVILKVLIKSIVFKHRLLHVQIVFSFVSDSLSILFPSLLLAPGVFPVYLWYLTWFICAQNNDG